MSQGNFFKGKILSIFTKYDICHREILHRKKSREIHIGVVVLRIQHVARGTISGRVCVDAWLRKETTPSFPLQEVYCHLPFVIGPVY